MTRNEELIRLAIAEKRAIFAHYDGFPRYLCPHMIGQKLGKLNALCYQFAGRGSKGEIKTPSVPLDGPPELWRCMEVEKFQKLEVQEVGLWYTCRKHTETSTCADRILAEVVWE